MCKALSTLLSFVILFVGIPDAQAQTPSSVICQFEKIATVELDEHGKITAGDDVSKGDLVLANLNTAHPTATGNTGTIKTDVIKKTAEAIWLMAYPPDTRFTHAPAETLTLFLKTNVVMHAKTELIEPLSGPMKPLGFVEIGRCRPVQ